MLVETGHLHAMMRESTYQLLTRSGIAGVDQHQRARIRPCPALSAPIPMQFPQIPQQTGGRVHRHNGPVRIPGVLHGEAL
jgi:hypothetical protein